MPLLDLSFDVEVTFLLERGLGDHGGGFGCAEGGGGLFLFEGEEEEDEDQGRGTCAEDPDGVPVVAGAGWGGDGVVLDDGSG